MSERESALQLLEQMRSRYDSGFSSADKSALNDLYRRLYGKNIRNSGCNNCFRDAYLLIYKKLKSIKSMPTFSDYKLKAGAVIHPAGTSKFYAHRLPSNDIAEAYLSKFPDKISLFSEYPSDWRERVQRYREYAEASASSTAEVSKTDASAAETITTEEVTTTEVAEATEEAVADEADVPAQREQETVADVVAQSDDKGGVEEPAAAEVAQEAVTEQPAATQATEQPAATATKQTTKSKRSRKKSA